MVLHRQIEWSLFSCMGMVRRNHGDTGEQGPLYLSIQHHGLFSPIPYMRTVTTLSVYTTTWSLLTNPIHENRDHSIWTDRVVPVLMYGIGEKRPWCCIDRYNGHWSHVWDWWEETMVLDRQIEWSLVSYHGFFSPIPCMRTGTTLSVYTTTWSLLTNPIHENRDHSICLYNTMVSSHQSHTWEQGPR
jgi:hypothetical protein